MTATKPTKTTDTPPLLLRQEMVDPTTLIPDPKNYRIHADAELKRGAARFGQYKPVVVNERTGLLVAGHGTVKAFIANNTPLVQVSYINVDAAEAAEILAWDNRSTELGTNDSAKLLTLLDEIHAAADAFTGYETDDREVLRRILEATTPPPSDPGPITNDWWDMPDYPDQVDGFTPFRKIIVAFADEAGVTEFTRLVGQAISPKAKSIWFPEKDKTPTKNFRVVSDE